ncbi:MAG: FUSC family protein, partial [Mycobacterium sp.]|nr:FUSC family protein [Mycobacterium sp.]
VSEADDPGTAAVRRLALAIINAAAAAAEVGTRVERVSAAMAGGRTYAANTDNAPAIENPDAGGQPRKGLLPTTRQAIQVSVAASLAIVAGEVVSPARWYWAVIAAFVIFAGTNSWGETLTKGWQRLAGTALGVPCGMVVATLVSGKTVVSVLLVFVCLFCAFYFMTVSYSLMILWITTMLALLYGLLGEFSVDVLLLRIEETALGAVIGVGVAILVLPTNTRTAIRGDARIFMTALSALIETSTHAMFGGGEAMAPTEQARQLDRDLQRFRTTAKPILAGIAGFGGRRSIQRGLQLFTACDHFGRTLAHDAERFQDAADCPELADAFTSAAARTRRNIDALVAAIDGAHAPIIASPTDELDAAETLARRRDAESPPRPDTRRILRAVHALRQIDRAVATAAADLGARDGATLSSLTPR